MRLFLIGAVLITFPAIVAAIYAIVTLGTWDYSKYMLAASVLVLFMNSLPFVAAAFLLRKDSDAADLGH
ncbi:MAG TPA: hypothetical protein VGR37_18010 [Longimicrobiaceae bacterium]|nr:hypothetical protein [Longimicrobiaceae bacterium]